MQSNYVPNWYEFNIGVTPRRRMQIMLQIIGSMKTLKGEAKRAKALCLDILGDLEQITASDNLTNRIGIYVRQMPDFKVLSKDAESTKQLLRKVCSGEITPADACEHIKDAINQLDIIISMLDSAKVL